MKVILISGCARHGKDETARLMKSMMEELGNKVLLTHFADLLKFICTNYFEWDGQKNEEGRSLLQHVGTDIIRSQNPDMWVDFIIQMLKYFGNEWEYVIIPDCRFPNEITKFSECGLDNVHIKVVRPGYNNNLTEEQQNHPSETALNNMIPDSYIYNDGSLEDLSNKVHTWIKEELYGRI